MLRPRTALGPALIVQAAQGGIAHGGSPPAETHRVGTTAADAQRRGGRPRGDQDAHLPPSSSVLVTMSPAEAGTVPTICPHFPRARAQQMHPLSPERPVFMRVPTQSASFWRGERGFESHTLRLWTPPRRCGAAETCGSWVTVLSPVPARSIQFPHSAGHGLPAVSS
jgi:hypothetical protein